MGYVELASNRNASRGHKRRKARIWLASAAALFLLLFAGITAIGSSTEQMPNRYGQVDTRLYVNTADGTTQRPLLVLLGGAEGGNSWTADVWKAQRDRFLDQGYALLAIGYFGLENTPEKLDRIALEGIHAAVVEASKDSRINGSCVALIGGSRGGELALLLGSYYSDIGAVVALVPASAVFPSLTYAMRTPGFAFEGQPLPFVPMNWLALPQLLSRNVGAVMEKMSQNEQAMQSAAIAVERINGPILLVSATEDEMWPSTKMSEAMMNRLRAHRFQPVHEHWPIPGGHGEPLDEFPRIETFLNEHFAPERQSGGCA